MTIKKYIIKTTVKVIAFIMMSIIASTLLQSPVISNEIALGQMENSNEAFMIMETYSKFVPIINFIYGCVVVWFAGTIIYDTYKFIKTKKGENKR